MTEDIFTDTNDFGTVEPLINLESPHAWIQCTSCNWIGHAKEGLDPGGFLYCPSCSNLDISIYAGPRTVEISVLLLSKLRFALFEYLSLSMMPELGEIGSIKVNIAKHILTDFCKEMEHKDDIFPHRDSKS